MIHMNSETIAQQLESLNIRPDENSNDESSKAINLLLQLIEGLHIENEKLKTEIQKLRDEINLLKGEQGKPNFPASKKKQKENISSESERNRLKPYPLQKVG